MFQYRDLSYVPEIIYSEVINYYHNDLLKKYFGIDKTGKLMVRKYY